MKTQSPRPNGRALLVLAARADGKFDRDELKVIADYAEQELLQMQRLGRSGLVLTGEMLEQLTKMIRELRPRPDYITEYLERVEAMNEAALGRFWRAMNCLLHADGDFSDDEAGFIDSLDAIRQR